MSLTISIVICTADGQDSLRETLHSLSEVHLPSNMSGEIIVLDNRPPSAQEVVESANTNRLDIRYAAVPERGKCRAFNIGLSLSTSDIIVTTDQDVRFSKDWLENLIFPIVNGDADAVTGTIRMAKHLNRPWMEDVHKLFLVESLRPIGPETHMVGANAAFHRRVLRDVPGLDIRLGPGALGCMEDTLFSMQVLAAGYKILFATGAVVEHHFDVTRLQRQSLIKHAQIVGRSAGYVDYHWKHVDVGNLAFRRFKKSLKIAASKLRSFNIDAASEGCDERVLTDIMEKSYYDQIAIERTGPPIYAVPNRPNQSAEVRLS